MNSFPILRAIQSAWRQRSVPGQLVIQITDACNARCPQCGMRTTEPFPRSRIPIKDIRRIIDAAAQKNFQAISFTGGEPLLLFDDLLEMIRHAAQSGIPCIRTGTNGFIFRESSDRNFTGRITHMAERLAASGIRNFWISIDSAVPEVHERMRGLPGVIAGIYKALPIFHECGIYPSANLGINRNLSGIQHEDFRSPESFYEHYCSGFDRFYHRICDMGFTMVNCCYPMSLHPTEPASGLSAVYAAAATAPVVNFSRMEKALLFKALLNTIPQYRSRIRIFTPRTSLLALYRHYTQHESLPYPCRGGTDFFFIDARNGHTYPCGYRGGEDLGRFEELLPADTSKNRRDCRLCDWECFRDPSELMGPILDLLTCPSTALKRFATDRTYARLWLEDILYYRACDFFDGRKAPKWERIRRGSCDDIE